MIKNDVSEETNRITEAIVDSAYTVHKKMGPGLLEGIYEACLVRELAKRNISVERQKTVPVFYDGEPLDEKMRVDLIVAGKVIVELKTVDALMPIHEAQVLTYLKLTNCEVGLLMNFNIRWMKDGIKRIALSRS